MLLLRIAACTSSDPALTILVASSLVPPMEILGPSFEREHGVDVVLVAGGSQQLATQLAHGLAADLFLTADPHLLDGLAEKGKLLDRRVFATGALVLLTRVPVADALAGIHQVERLAIADQHVPLGAYTQAWLATLSPEEQSRVRARVVTHELSARGVLAKFQLGEVDGAIVYASDAGAAPSVPLLGAPAATYEAGRLSASSWAEAFQDGLSSDTGREVLRSHGFMVPGG